MDYLFSERVKELKPSAIREIFKYATDPNMISLSAGNPDPQAFPVQAVSEITADIFAKNPIDALQYSTTEGYGPLRSHLSKYMQKKHSVGRDSDDLIITSGAQQVMDLFTKSMCNEGDVIVCEEPSFIGSLNTFRSYKARLCGIPMEADGMDLHALEDVLQTQSNIKFIYTIPNFQNPSGITMSLEKRKRLYAFAKTYGVMILEDNPYGDIRVSGPYIPAIKSMDEDGIVMYAGTFSKVISPGLRVGYAIGPADIIKKMVVCKQGEDVHSNILSQMICHRFMTQYDYEAHLKMLPILYKKKIDLCVQAMEQYFAPYITWNTVEGGLFVWCTLPEKINMMDFCKQAVLHRVCVVPGNAFLVDESKAIQSFRVNFSTPTSEQLLEGIQILGNLCKEMMEA